MFEGIENRWMKVREWRWGKEGIQKRRVHVAGSVARLQTMSSVDGGWIRRVKETFHWPAFFPTTLSFLCLCFLPGWLTPGAPELRGGVGELKQGGGGKRKGLWDRRTEGGAQLSRWSGRRWRSGEVGRWSRQTTERPAATPLPRHSQHTGRTGRTGVEEKPPWATRTSSRKAGSRKEVRSLFSSWMFFILMWKLEPIDL